MRAGAWRTAIEDIGIPVGRPQTVVVDLRGRFARGTRRSASPPTCASTGIRFWWTPRGGGDADADDPPRPGRRATLRWRGFSAEVTPDGREPLGYDYARVRRVSPWKADDRPLHARRATCASSSARTDDHVRDRHARATRSRSSFDAAGAAAARRPAARARSCSTPTATARRWTSTRPAPTASSRCRSTGMTRYPYGRRSTIRDSAAHREYLAALQHPHRPRPICRRSSARTELTAQEPSMDHESVLRYSAAACQTDLPNPLDRRADARRTPTACWR